MYHNKFNTLTESLGVVFKTVQASANEIPATPFEEHRLREYITYTIMEHVFTLRYHQCGYVYIKISVTLGGPTRSSCCSMFMTQHNTHQSSKIR